MLREEIQEVEQAIEGGVLHNVLAESVDILYLTLNLLQESVAAFLLKHDDNMKKQHETVAHLTWTRNVHTKSCNSTDAEIEYTVSRTAGGKRLLYSKGKLAKPCDHVLSDLSVVIKETSKNVSGSV